MDSSLAGAQLATGTPLPVPAVAAAAEVAAVDVEELEEGAPALPSTGDRIGQYEIIRELGRGGMGAVFAARDTKLGRKVAIKVLSGQTDPEVTAPTPTPLTEPERLCAMRRNYGPDQADQAQALRAP